MSRAIAFFPWVYTEDPLEIGDVRLIPFRRGSLPGDLPNASQKDIDSVLQAYAIRRGVQVTRATLLEVGNWVTGSELSAERMTELFNIREGLTFAALSQRAMFARTFSYCNADSYRLVVQRYESGKAHQFSFRTRRRDGAVDRMWSTNHFSFHCPLHVDPARADIDVRLFQAIRRAPQRFHEAIVDFNAANTDADEIPAHVELVMAKSAFEWLLGLDEKWQSLWGALKEIFGSLPVSQYTPLLVGANPSAWTNRWPNRGLLEAWVRDFCLARNEAAHGSDRDGKAVWHPVKHLLFVAVLFPLLVKLELTKECGFDMDARDLQRLAQAEAYICHDPWLTMDGDDRFAWAELDLQARMRAISATFFERE